MSSNWECTLCEYSNPSVISRCEMCDSPNSSFQPLEHQFKSQSISNNDQHNISQNYNQEQKQPPIQSKPIEQISETHWTCEQCNGKNNHTDFFCGVCGFKKGYNAKRNNNNNNNKQEIKEDIKEEPKSNHIISNKEHKQQESIYNYNIGDEIFYPTDYIKLQNNLSLYKNYPLPTNNPSKYSLGCILSLDKQNYKANITDIILNDNQTICINFELITHKFNIFKYNSLCVRGTSISFYNSETCNWTKGRIEYALDNNIGIQYGNDLFIQVPIYYIKQYEELKEDEWSNVSDFVFKEYIRDVAIELIMKNKNKKSNNNNAMSIEPNEFMFAMEKLGVKSAISRNKAFRLFEEIENDIILKEKRRLEEGHIIGQYKCIGICNLIKETNGIYLSNCKHAICKNDFSNLLENVITNRAQRLLKCPKCVKEINPIDIQRHGNDFQYSIITQMQLDQVQYTFDAAKCLNCGQGNDIMDGLEQYVCMYCGTDNCLKCKKMHSCEITCNEFKMGDHTFRKQWISEQKNNNLQLNNNMAVLTEVNKNSNEWNDIVNHMKYSPNKIIKIERIEHNELWNKYYTYLQSLGNMLQEVRVWHGTRKTHPSLIYKNGFLKEKSRIGGCLWYAVNSSYSMNGFQHPCGNGKSQLFLCLVAGGNLNDVKYIRNNKILNVYKNEATYPAYLITYK